MKVRIVKDRTRDGFLPVGGFTLMMPSWFGWRDRRRFYSCWFATKEEAEALVADPNWVKAAYEKAVLWNH